MTDHPPLDQLFIANRAAIARYLRARLRGEGDGEDILQDLWLKLAAHDPGPVAQPLAYLYRMAENLVLDRSRASHRRFRRESEWTNGQVDGSLANAIDARPSTERVLMARDYLRHVNTALETLPEPTVIAFRAVRIDGTPQKQVAAMLGISLSAVEKHLQRAYRMIAALKLRLDAETPAPRRHTIERIDDGH